MPKYKIKFETEVQVDGWSDHRDYELEKCTETITVEAKNEKLAKLAATKKAHGYYYPAYWGYGSTCKWHSDQIVKIVRLKFRE